MNIETNHPALAPAGVTYTVVAEGLGLPRGARFTVEPGPVEVGQLALIEIGGLETVGRYYSDVSGCDWIVQPGLLTQVTGKVPVRVVGRVLVMDMDVVNLN